MDIRALKQQRAKLLTEGEKIASEAAAANRRLTDEEKARLDAINTDVDGLDADIARLEKIHQRDRTATVATDPLTRAFNGDPMCGFRDAGEFAVAVAQACRPGGHHDPRLAAIMAAPTNVLQEQGGTSGEGFNVPPAIRQAVWDLVMNDDNILTMVDAEPSESDVVEMGADESTPWATSGIVAKLRTETQQMTPTKLATDGRTVKKQELYVFVNATNAVLRDAARLANRIVNKASQAMAWKISELLMWGNGAGSPLGWMAAPSLVTISKESGQAAATVVAANAMKMFARLLDVPGDQPVWFANKSTAPQIMQFTIGNQPIWTPPAGGLAQAPGGFLLGYPIKWSHHAEALGTKGDLQLVSPKGYYATTDPRGIEFAESMHLFFDYGLQAFRWTFRFGGQPYLSAAVSPAKGSSSLSHFVCVETRS